MTHVPNQYRNEPYGSPLYASFLVALQEFIGAAALNFHLTLASPTAVQVAAGEASAQVGLGIDGLWRFIYATANTAISGSAGTQDLFAVCGDNEFDSNPDPPPPEIDNTVYSFGLVAVAHGGLPTPSGSVTHWRKVGEVDWSGTQITGLRTTVGEVDNSQPVVPTAASSALTPVRVIAATGQTASMQIWQTALGAALATLTAAGGLTLSDVLTAASAVLTGALTADSAALQTLTVANAAQVGASSTCPTVTPYTDSTTKMASTEFVQHALQAWGITKTHRDTHVVAWDDKTAPRSNASVVGSIPITLGAGQTAKLLGVKMKCSVAGGTVMKVQTDKAVHGTLVDVAGLTGLTPAIGAYVQTMLGTPLALSDGDEVAVLTSTPGTSLGVKLALVFEYTF